MLNLKIVKHLVPTKSESRSVFYSNNTPLCVIDATIEEVDEWVLRMGRIYEVTIATYEHKQSSCSEVIESYFSAAGLAYFTYTLANLEKLLVNCKDKDISPARVQLVYAMSVDAKYELKSFSLHVYVNDTLVGTKYSFTASPGDNDALLKSIMNSNKEFYREIAKTNLVILFSNNGDFKADYLINANPFIDDFSCIRGYLNSAVSIAEDGIDSDKVHNFNLDEIKAYIDFIGRS